MLRDIKTYQRLARKIYVKVDGSDVGGGTLTTNGLKLGSQQVKISETGNGAYTITLNEPGSRACFAVGVGLTDNSYITIPSTTASTVLVVQETVTTGAALADADFWLEITAFDSADET